MKRRFYLWICVLLLAVIICLISAFYIMPNHYYSKIETTDSLTKEEVKDKEEELGIINIALLGIDKLDSSEDGRSES